MVKNFIYLALAFALLSPDNHAADLVGHYMITDRIILLHFDDGSIDYHGLGEAAWNDDKPTISRLDLELATQLSSFTVHSNEDGNYAEAQMPKSINRKSKGGDFSPVNNTVFIHEHYIYLTLPYPLQPGNKYTVQLIDLAENTESVSIDYQPEQMYSPSVHTNMFAYSTLSNLKYGYVYQWMGDGGGLDLEQYNYNTFYLIETATGDTAYSSKMTLRKDISSDPKDTYNTNDSPYFTMADVYQCNFSSFNEPGTYKLYVEQIGCSYPFEIKEDAFREAFQQTAWGLYHQRSGPERSMPESPWPKGIDHTPGINGFSIEYSEWRIMDGNNAFEELPAHATGEVFPDNPGDWMPENPEDWGWGGYFDAGDFDRRHVHMSVSEALMFAYELRPRNFIDSELRIPEINNGIPDILDEARWAIDMHRRLQGPTGGICGGMEQNEHPGPGVNSVTDDRPWFVYAEEPQASYHLAAANTQLAWCLALAGNMTENDSLLSQAERVYAWAANNMRANDEDKVDTYRMRAAAWLFRYTGKEQYHEQFLADYNKGVRDDFAAYAYIFNDHPDADGSIQQQLKNDILTKANKNLSAGKQRATRWANFDLYGIHRVGSASTPYIFPLVLAYEFTGKSEYLDYAYTTADHFMGGNSINKVYVTGLGESHVETLLHLDSWFDGVEPMVPGIVPYGLHTYGTWMDGGSGNVYQPLGNFESCYPSWQEWPSHELWFENRYLIIQNEFTVQQTQGPATAGYALLTAPIHPSDVEAESVKLNHEMLNIDIDASYRLIASVAPFTASNKNVHWSTTDAQVLQVEDGIVLGLAKGEAYIVVATEDGNISDSCLVKVDGGSDPTSSINEKESIYRTGQHNTTWNIRLWPNPNNGSFFIESEGQFPENFAVKIHSLHGRVIFSESFKDEPPKMIHIAGNDLSDGIYLLNISDEKGLRSAHRKLIIQ